jgi:hypothetical protein
MTQLSTPVRTHRHPLAEQVIRCGWRVCSGSPAGGTRIERKGRKLRVTLSDAPLPVPMADWWERARAGAEVVATGLPSRVLPPGLVSGPSRRSRRSAPEGTASGGLTTVELFPEGQVVVSCRDTPSLLHIAGDGDVNLLPSIPGGLPDMALLRPGERLLAFTPALLQTTSPQVLVDLTEAARSGLGSCAVWQRWAAGRGAENESGEPAGELIVVTRSAPGTRPSGL